MFYLHRSRISLDTKFFLSTGHQNQPPSPPAKNNISALLHCLNLPLRNFLPLSSRCLLLPLLLLISSRFLPNSLANPSCCLASPLLPPLLLIQLLIPPRDLTRPVTLLGPPVLTLLSSKVTVL